MEIRFQTRFDERITQPLRISLFNPDSSKVASKRLRSDPNTFVIRLIVPFVSSRGTEVEYRVSLIDLSQTVNIFDD